MKIQTVKTQMSMEEVHMLAALENVSKSEKVRQMFIGGIDVKTIAKELNIRYNFAYNVLSNYININGVEVEKSERDGSGRAAVIEALKTHDSLAEVSKVTKVNYNQVWKIAKEIGMTKKQLAETAALEAKVKEEEAAAAVKTEKKNHKKATGSEKHAE